MDFSVSPVANTDYDFYKAIEVYSNLGYKKIEFFAGWHIDINKNPEEYKNFALKHSMHFSSLHFPKIEDDTDKSIENLLKTYKFSKKGNFPVGIIKAKSKKLYIEVIKEFIKKINDNEVTLVITNHYKTCVETLKDYEEVLNGINSERIKCLFEVGQFHSAGIKWKDAYDFLKGRIALVHLKDQIGTQSVPFGKGEIDIKDLIFKLLEDGYDGDIVIEMEVKDRENVHTYLKDGLNYLKEIKKEWNTQK